MSAGINLCLFNTESMFLDLQLDREKKQKLPFKLASTVQKYVKSMKRQIFMIFYN